MMIRAGAILLIGALAIGACGPAEEPGVEVVPGSVGPGEQPTEMAPEEPEDAEPAGADSDAAGGTSEESSLDPSAGVPEGCPMPTETEAVLVNDLDGFCLLRPVDYQVEQPSPGLTTLTLGGPLDVENPRLHITVSDAAGRTAAEIADQIEADFAVPGVTIARSTTTIEGNEAIVLDGVPGQDINRRVVFVSGERAFDLVYSPADPERPEVLAALESLYEQTTGSLHVMDEWMRRE
jgi:hypothetical protein